MTGWAARRKLLLAMGWMAVAVPMWGQDAVAGGKALMYDAVSIKPNKPEGGDRISIRIQTGGDRYSASGVSLKGLIQYAYNLKMEDQISGVTGPVSNARFDIEAKIDEDTVAALKKLSNDESNTQRRLLMQGMLADRFKLKVHHETKEMPIYSLVIAKGGFKLKDADPNDTYPNGFKGLDGASHAGMMRISNDTLTAQAIPISNLANNLSLRLHRQVVDNTGLTGKYDMTLKWAPDENRGEAGADGSAADSGPSIFTALQEQLGLKLEPTKGPVETIVVDHVEMPSEN
ncbi:MAG: TIGR03435 family protein [Edaphobacter sp.]